MYSQLKSCVKVNNGLTHFFDCHIGTRQGCVSSPIIFSLFINDLISYLRTECDWGIFVTDQIEDIIGLLFADDVASFSDTIVRLQHQINCKHRFCESVGMSLNLLKTKIIVFRNGGIVKQIEKWYYNGQLIDIVPFYKYLGVYFTPKLVWSKTKEVLARQASKAVCRIFQYQRNFGNFSPNEIFKLFDSIVQPILCYGSEIWGYEYSKQIEKIHILFCKRYIGLHQNTADFFALSECGRHPLAVSYMSQCVKYWVRVIQMPNHRYPKQCYNMLRPHAAVGKVNWASNVRSLLYKYGFGYAWEADTIGNSVQFICSFKQRIKDCFMQELHSHIDDSPKALYYKHFKSSLKAEHYLNIDLPYMYKKILSNFRCSSHCLMIEKGRHQNIERSLRFCPLCLRRNAYVIEDEFHFFFVCPIYAEIRNIYFKADWIRNIITPHKFYEIMSRADTSSILAVSKFLVSAFRYRNELLQND